MRQPSPFTLWGPDHVTVLVLTVGGALALVGTRASMRRVSDVSVRRVAALVLLGNELISWMWAAAHGVVRVPLQLCDLALVLTAVALLTLRPRVTELAYFWGLAGSLQAILTPDLHDGFPDYWWVKFFITHCGVVLSAVYLAVTGRVASTGRSVWRIWGLTNLYAALAGMVNWAFGTNYGYLARKPMHPSLLDYCGPWPGYILVMEVLALGLLFLAYLPFVGGRRLHIRT